ncbi:MAG: BMP family ABC transporter substrate-binding protein [Actinobacteria bacterium]|nr:BMP family ABC transporter substrate-binding protein [Actinomycetota bacterium]
MEGRLRVGLVIGGDADAPSLDLLAREGLERARDELGIDGHVLTSRTSSGYRRNLTTLAKQDYDVVIAVGRHRSRALAAVAARFPAARFAIVDAGQADLGGSPRNVRGLVFKEEEAGYLAGYLTGLVTRHESGSRPVIGSVGGRKVAWVDRYIAGYRAGARAANPKITTLNAYAQDFGDRARCKTIALDQIARGASVIFQVAGECGLGALAAAGEKNVRGVGVDVDQSYLGEHVLTSAVKRVDEVVFQTVQALQEGSFQGGEDVMFDVASGGVGLGEVAADVPADLVSRVNEIEDAIASGKIVSIPETVG